MRKVISRFTSSFAALLSDQSTVIDAEGRAEEIRAAMLHALSESDHGQASITARARSNVGRAGDIQALWYLRSDVLHHLADSYGELTARKKLDTITELFRGAVPDNQMPVARRMSR